MAKSLKSAMINAAFGIPKVMDQYGDDPYIKETKPNVGKILNLFKKPRMAMAGLALATCAAIEKDPDLNDYLLSLASLIFMEAIVLRKTREDAPAGDYYIDTAPDTAPMPPSNKVYEHLFLEDRAGKIALAYHGFVWPVVLAVGGAHPVLLAHATLNIINYAEPIVKLKMIEDGEWSVSETPPAQPEKQKAEDAAALPQPEPA